MLTLQLMERLAFLVRCCTSESVSKKSHVITHIMLSINAIYQEYPQCKLRADTMP